MQRTCLGIDRLWPPRPGRVIRLAGGNGAGKSTVIDAVRVYASRGRSAVLREPLGELPDAREELATPKDDDHARSPPAGSKRPAPIALEPKPLPARPRFASGMATSAARADPGRLHAEVGAGAGTFSPGWPGTGRSRRAP